MNAEVNARSSGVQDLAFTFAFAFTGNERRSRSRSPINERVRERRSFERRSLMLCSPTRTNSVLHLKCSD